MIKRQSFEEPSEKPTLPLEYQFAIFRQIRRNRKLLRVLDKILLVQVTVTIMLILRWLIFS